MLRIYSLMMGANTFFLRSLLNKRCRKGKEDPERLGERMGEPGRDRPDGPLVWFHAASVGESQSTLILINAVLKENPEFNILVTTGTVTSAELMAKRLPRQAFHQYYPLDHPKWVCGFLDHWQPDLAVWMESEIWPNMLMEIKKRNIPATIVNARLSKESFSKWRLAGNTAEKILETFSVVMTQTEDDAELFRKLHAPKVVVTDNLKYSAAPLPYEQSDFDKLKDVIKDRPVWLYASTHDGEEDIACRIHAHLKKKHPDLITIIAPRHPNRGDAIFNACQKFDLKVKQRTANKKLPQDGDEIYIADTMGELGLFYTLSPIACIGRSFSNDGGGGHNPIEAAQLHCAILCGPNVQNLQQIFDEFKEAGAVLQVKTEQELQNRLEKIFGDHDGMEALQNKAFQFAGNKAKVLDKVLKELAPLTAAIGENNKQKRCA